MRKLLGTLNVVALILSLVGSARAAVLTAEIRDAAGDPHSVRIANTAQDVHFSLEIFATSDFDLVSLQLKVESLDGTGIFSLNTLTFDSEAGWGDHPVDFMAPDDLVGAPRGQSSQLIGCLPVSDYVSAGTSSYATIDAIVKAGTPQGQYRLNLTDVLGGNSDYDEILDSAGLDYVVQVLPEPATLLLVAGGLVLYRRRVRV